MSIGIRNRDISFGQPIERKSAMKRLDAMTIKKFDEVMKLLMDQLPELYEEQRKFFDESERIRLELEEKIWAYFEEHPENDLDGNPIKRETHEIGFDIENMEVDGLMYCITKNVYVRPKKIEYNKN